jgi:hypothetical protein
MYCWLTTDLVSYQPRIQHCKASIFKVIQDNLLLDQQTKTIGFKPLDRSDAFLELISNQAMQHAKQTFPRIFSVKNISLLKLWFCFNSKFFT